MVLIAHDPALLAVGSTWSPGAGRVSFVITHLPRPGSASRRRSSRRADRTRTGADGPPRSANRAGDQLVVTQLHRLGRSAGAPDRARQAPADQRGRSRRAGPGDRHLDRCGAPVLSDQRRDREFDHALRRVRRQPSDDLPPSRQDAARESAAAAARAHFVRSQRDVVLCSAHRYGPAAARASASRPWRCRSRR